MLLQVLFASFLLATLNLHAKSQIQTPDFGPNVLLLDPSQGAAEMQAKIDHIYATQQHNEFGVERNEILMMPGEYHLNIPLGYYTEVRGLGATPDTTHVYGNVHADASLPHNNGTCVFWRGVENFAVTPEGGDRPGVMQWAVSQAAPMRRMHIKGNVVLHDHGGWVSGGWMSDTKVDGQVDSGGQQQWISRNSDWASWTGSNWNMVFVGVPHAPEGIWPQPAYTKIAETPVDREKPFLQIDKNGHWGVQVPPLRRNSAGISWQVKEAAGATIPLDRFYIAHPERDSAATINRQLEQGKHLLLTPGVYNLTEPLLITHPGTVVLGLGFATLRPTHGAAAVVTSDVDGLTLSGLLIDAGPQLSPVLMQVGEQGSHVQHRANPIVLHDVFFRDGGADEGKTVGNLEVNADDTIIDHTWIWRADHGHHVGWTDNLSQNGLVVNGDGVTAYGLFVEHHQQFQTLWNGDRGRSFLYQSEIPYDPPTQAAFTSAPGTQGWASYKVADTVHQHEAWGLGVYSVFRFPEVVLRRAIEAPETSGIRFHDMITTCLDDKGAILNIVNNTGGAATCKPRSWPRLISFP